MSEHTDTISTTKILPVRGKEMEIKQVPSAYAPFMEEELVVKVKPGHVLISTSSGSVVRKGQAETQMTLR